MVANKARIEKQKVEEEAHDLVSGSVVSQMAQLRTMKDEQKEAKVAQDFKDIA